MTSAPGSLSAPIDGPAPELDIARDLARRALPVAPVAVVVSGLIWGIDGAVSAAYAMVLVVANFLAAALLMARAARISATMLMAAVLGGYLLRLGVITVAVLAVRDAAWVELMPLGLTLVLTHVGLLVWEARKVSVTLAFPGLKPAGSPGRDQRG
ncbi:MAG: ATP synthase subunit I [Actinobacteria bacterium]|nr:ATP synthase subunit I [Actinomycetota bacterium]